MGSVDVRGGAEVAVEVAPLDAGHEDTGLLVRFRATERVPSVDAHDQRPFGP